MENTKKLKIYLGISYIILISTFLYYFFSKFSLQEVSSYEFIKNNVDYFSNLKNKNYFTLIITFFFLCSYLGFVAGIWFNSRFSIRFHIWKMDWYNPNCDIFIYWFFIIIFDYYFLFQKFGSPKTW